MSTKPLLSIITCFLNEERFLEEAIESVLQQDYQHWELLLIDDGSTDKSTGIAKKYAQNYPGKIIYSEHEGHANRGLSASRNHALRQASGEFIAFLDGDDVWLPDLLSQLLMVMQQQAPSMVCEATEYWYSWKNAAKKDTIIPVGTKENKMYPPPQLLLNLYPLGKGAAPCLCGILVKKYILKKHGGFDEAFKGMYEDQAFLIKLYLNEYVYISSGCSNRYRQREGSLVNTSHMSGKYHQERKHFLEWLKQYLKSTGTKHPKVKKLLEHALFPYRQPLLYLMIHKMPMKGKDFLMKILHKLK